MPNGFVSFVRFVFFKKNTFAPHHHFVVTFPYKQGKSAIRQTYSP